MSKKALETRQRILGIAFEHASEHGLESLTIGELAKLAGMSKSGLFSHFQSKENLQISVLEYAGNAFTERVVQPVRRKKYSTVREKLEALLTQWMAWNHAFQGSCMFLNAWRSGDAPEGDVQAALEGLTSHWLEYLNRQFEAGVASGEFLETLDCWQTVYRLYGSYLSSQLFYSLRLETESRDRFWREVEKVLDEVSRDKTTH
ncbi:TetR/AcrR family transcriptional regulator [Thaumasiovibrio subtropicus]|uniref:TetR/AcrR family transcriptional regulator n=1 Tax=Thaumasiovibrio subtropicus TaxID=1891207 RepID=UPI000B354D09|nr:TetR/AcrR family transcriptional regulator [Thaumasiovibrio subtropicus]